jgi:hypothetical protein
MFGGTVALANGSTLSVVRVSTIRFQMWDDMIRMIIDIRYVLGVRRSLVSVGRLDLRVYEI